MAERAGGAPNAIGKRGPSIGTVYLVIITRRDEADVKTAIRIVCGRRN